MRKIFKYALWLLGGLVLLVALAATYNVVAPLPTYETDIPTQVDIPHGDSATIARGARLVSINCTHCHRNQDGNLAGQPAIEKDFGQLYVPNITNHPEAGIGRYSDEELVHLLRTGLRPNGELVIPIMSTWHELSDEDLYSIIAFLRSDAPMVQPVEKYWPASQPNFLAKALMRLAFKPKAMPTAPIPMPDMNEPEVYGKYLADGVFHCYNCHSASFQTNNDVDHEQSAGYYGGGNPIMYYNGKLGVSSNLTMHPEHGLGGWTVEDFQQTLRQVRRPDGTSLHAMMAPYSLLSEEESAAIWAFLQTVPIIDNDPKAELAQQ